MKVRLIGVAVVLAAAAVYVAVSGSGGSSPKLSVAHVHAAAAGLGAHGTGCPLRFDRAAAAEAAGADTPLVPATGPDDAPYGDVPEGADPGSAAVRYGLSTVDCRFTTTVGGRPVTLKLLLVAASKGPALTAVAPELQRDAELSQSTLEAFFAQKIAPGQVRVAQGDAAAAVGRFDPDGSGEVILEVAQELSDGAEPAAVRWQPLAEKLLGQIEL